MSDREKQVTTTNRHQQRFVRVKPKDRKGVLKRIWLYYKAQHKALVFLFGVVLIQTITTLISPYLIGQIIDKIKLGNGMNTSLAFQILGLFTCYVIGVICVWSQAYILADTAANIVEELRQDLFEKLNRLPIGFFDHHPHGDILSRFTNDVDNISQNVSTTTTQLMGGILSVSGSFIMMMVLSPLLTLGTMLVVPLMYLLTRFISKRIRELFRDQQKSIGDMYAVAEESISGLSVVQAYDKEAQLLETFNRSNDTYFHTAKYAQIYSGLLMPLMNVISNLSFGIIGLLGGYLVITQGLTIGVIASFLTYSRQFIRPLNELASTYSSFQSALAGAERVFAIIDETEEVDEQYASSLTIHKGRVTFENVNFSYVKDEPVLDQVSFHVEPGKKIALVGPTGSGKTTIVNLLSRFYDKSSGSILIDDLPIEAYNRNQIRNDFGIVLQDAALFSGTIMENIRYGKLNASTEEVHEAAKLANMHQRILLMEEGYETLLVDGGMNLSQGERQLITIARAIIANPKILVLDEATSSVDTRTEKHIQDAMVQLMHNRTSFIIAHRLSTIRDADAIYVLEHGRIIEHGSHDELMVLDGFYASMIHQQIHGVIINDKSIN